MHTTAYKYSPADLGIHNITETDLHDTANIGLLHNRAVMPERLLSYEYLPTVTTMCNCA